MKQIHRRFLFNVVFGGVQNRNHIRNENEMGKLSQNINWVYAQYTDTLTTNLLVYSSLTLICSEVPLHGTSV